MYAIIKEIELYKERLEPAWEYPDHDDQWLFAETVREYAGTQYDVLFVDDNNRYREYRGVSDKSRVFQEAKRIARNDLSYDDAKARLRKKSFWRS